MTKATSAPKQGRNKPKRKRERYAPTRPTRLPHATAADRVSNGSTLINGLDKRSVAFRRWKVLYLQYRDRVPDTVEGDQLCRALASACVRREQMDADICNNKPVDPVALTRMTSLVARLLTKLNTLATAKAEEAKPKGLGALLLEDA